MSFNWLSLVVRLRALKGRLERLPHALDRKGWAVVFEDGDRTTLGADGTLGPIGHLSVARQRALAGAVSEATAPAAA